MKISKNYRTHRNIYKKYSLILLGSPKFCNDIFIRFASIFLDLLPYSLVCNDIPWFALIVPGLQQYSLICINIHWFASIFIVLICINIPWFASIAESMLNRGNMPRKRTGRKWWNSSRPQCATSRRHSRLRAHWLMALVGGVGGGWGRSMYSAFPGNCSVSYLSFVYGRSLWTELNGGENFLHWKAYMLPLFSIMTLWQQYSLICNNISYLTSVKAR